MNVLDKFRYSKDDPSQLNRQGNGVGRQYRSIIFYTNEFQKETTRKYIKKLVSEETYTNVTTKIEKMENQSNLSWRRILVPGILN